MKLKCLILSLFIVTGFCAQAQKKYKLKGGEYKSGKQRYRANTGNLKRSQTDIFPLDRTYRLSGWYASIGVTKMIPIKKGEGSATTTATSTSRGDTITTTSTTVSEYEAKGKGDFGILYADLGYFKSFNNPGFFHFWEVGLSYRVYKGSERFSGTSTSTGKIDSLGNIQTTSSTTAPDFVTSYNDRAVSLVAKITRHRHFSQYGFFQHSFGLNVDYFLNGEVLAPVPAGFETIYEPLYHSQINAQIGYRFGVGWKASPTLLIVPSIEIPFLTAYDFNKGIFAMPYFSTKQMPLIFTIRAMLLRKVKQECRTPTYNGPANFP